MRFIHLFLLSLISILSQAQTITGVVKDSMNDETISYASVRLLNQNDSIFVIGAITAEDGSFKIQASHGTYILDISYMGYNKLKKKIVLTKQKRSLDLGNLYLTEINYELNTISVTAPIPDIIVKGDTIEYNADAYKVKDDALLQDLIRRLPGVEISADGKLMANGKIITKLLVDGKEFFDNDIDLALKNLPANMVNKLQLFKEQSETSKITGFKDNDPQQVINLTIKDGYKENIFGNARIGYGTDSRYSNKVNAQYMVDDNQYALIGNMNNVTDDFEYSGLSSQYDGITKNKDIGFNFNAQRNKNLKVGGNIKYEDNNNLFEMESNTTSFIESGSRMNKQTSASEARKRELRAGSNLKWTPDSLTTLYARFNIGTGTNDERRNSTSQSYIINKTDTTQGRTDYITSGDTHNITGSLTFGRKLNSRGRTISVALNGTTRGGRSNGTNKSATFYQGSGENKLIDQELRINNSGQNLGLMLSYVEPIGKDKFLQFAYNYKYEKSDRDRFTYVRDDEGEYTKIDSAYTRNTSTQYNTQRINLSLQSIKEKFEYTVGLNIEPTSSRNETNIGDSIIEKQRQHVTNFTPTLRFSYKPKKNVNLDFDYYGATDQPLLRQLSADTTIIDALSKTYGNPDLKPSFQNNVNIYFQKSNFEKGSFFTISAGGNYTINKIVDYTITDQWGNTETTYRNVQGNWGVNGGLMFSLPLRNKKITIDNSSYGYLMRNIGFSNGIKNITTNLTMSESFSINYRSDNFTQRLQGTVSYNITRNNLPEQENLNVSNYGFKSSTLVNLPYSINIQNEISYNRNIGYSDEFKKSELLWNIAISKQFLREKQASVKIQCYDIFNDRNNVLRVTAANYISDTKTNMIGQYVMLSFNYQFSIRPKGSNNEPYIESDIDY